MNMTSFLKNLLILLICVKIAKAIVNAYDI